MGEFLYYEGALKEAIEHFMQAEAMIVKYIPVAKNKERLNDIFKAYLKINLHLAKS